MSVDSLPSPSPLPNPPFFAISGIANFRDIGGYPCSSASNACQSVRRGVVFRSADPSRVDPAGLQKMKDLGITKVFDLRSVPEIKRDGPEWQGVKVDAGVFAEAREEGEQKEGRIERVWCPVFADKDYGPEKVAVRYREYAKNGPDGFVRAYQDILAAAPDAYRTILTHLSRPSPEPCLIHCTAGKDRTGVLVALLYLLCSVPTDVIAQEYALTDRGLEHLKPLFIERLLKNPALEGSVEKVQNMISSKAENMAATLEMIQEVYGGAEAYVKEKLGLDEGAIQRLRRNLVSDEKPVLPKV